MRVIVRNLFMKSIYIGPVYFLAGLCFCGLLAADDSVGPKSSVNDFKAAEAKAESPSTGTAKPSAPGMAWQSLFDGETLTGWQIIDFAGGGEVSVPPAVNDHSNASNSTPGHAILLEVGETLTGIKCAHEFPRIEYEISLYAMRVDGADFFCGLTFPVNQSCCTLVVGGWGGRLVGISSLDGKDASENETTQYKAFLTGRWYNIRVRVTGEMIEVWIDQKKMASVKHKGRQIGLRQGEISRSKPFGIASYQTSAALRDIKWRPLEDKRTDAN